jgi:hypothetical protein
MCWFESSPGHKALLVEDKWGFLFVCGANLFAKTDKQKDTIREADKGLG